MINVDFWKDKKVFVTGHTGFKGSWLCLWLQSMGAIVKGYSLVPNTVPSLFEAANVSEGMISEIGDIRDFSRLLKSINNFQPEIVLHLAAQPLVRRSYQDPIETYSTNVMGTVNLLEACRKTQSVKAIVNVTTDKCYENKEWEWGYRENEPMGGYDPYSSSKGCSELVTSAYRRSFFENAGVGLASARAGNVIGGGDWSEDRLIPDIIRAFEKNEPVIIRNPKATRPWQHVLEPLSGYLLLAEKLYHDPKKYSGAWNFGPNDEDAKPVEWILNEMTRLWDGAIWRLDHSEQPHEAKYLKLDISKARAILNWQPTWDLCFTLQRIVSFHERFIVMPEISSYCINEIKMFVKHYELRSKIVI